MNDLIIKVEQWAEDRNIIKGCNPIDQAMKLFSEAGELADNIGKGRDIKDDVGDVFVVLIVLSKQLGNTLTGIGKANWAEGNNKQLVVTLQTTLSEIVQDACMGYWSYGLMRRALNILNAIAKNHNTTVEDCLLVAYDEIKDRKGVMYNGTFIKSTDIAYNETLEKLK